ncbi:hypothetical protein MXB_3793, partial [Myxobolus squamalis]
YYKFAKDEDIDPYIICCSSVYLACKIEEVPLKAQKLIELIDQKDRLDIKNAIIAAEIRILEIIDFDICFKSPFTALEGILLELKAYNYFKSDEQISENYPKCMEFIKTCLLIQPLVHEYSMSQLAGASVMSSYGFEVFDTYLSKICPEFKEKLSELYNKIIQTLNDFKFEPEYKFDLPVFEIDSENAQILC